MRKHLLIVMKIHNSFPLKRNTFTVIVQKKKFK